LSITTKDLSKPDGEACNEDGTLKDASEMDWPDSPSEPAAPATLKRAHGDDVNERDGEDGRDGEDTDGDGNSDDGGPMHKRQRVSESFRRSEVRLTDLHTHRSAIPLS
jgi:hypothetical protein